MKRNFVRHNTKRVTWPDYTTQKLMILRWDSDPNSGDKLQMNSENSAATATLQAQAREGQQEATRSKSWEMNVYVSKRQLSFSSPLFASRRPDDKDTHTLQLNRTVLKENEAKNNNYLAILDVTNCAVSVLFNYFSQLSCAVIALKSTNHCTRQL